MNKLLNANFHRLGRDKSFHLTAAAALLISFAMILSLSGSARESIRHGLPVAMDEYFLNAAPLLGIYSATFVSLFLGREYSSGTIRNKISVGHRRSGIYLANLLVCCAACGSFVLLWLLASIPGLFLVGPLDMGLDSFLLYVLAALGFTAAFTAIYTMAASLCTGRTRALLINWGLCIILMLAASALTDRLEEVEFHGGMALIDGQFIMQEATPNPLYLRGTARSVCEFLLELLPSGQSVLMANAEISHPLRQLLLSLLLAAAVTGLGIVLFNRKDIK